MTARYITFVEPSGSCGWKVKYDGRSKEYPFVSLGEDGMFQVKKGDIYYLENLHITGAQYRGDWPGDQGKIVWDITGLKDYTDSKNPRIAQFVVHRGPDVRVNGRMESYR